MKKIILGTAVALLAASSAYAQDYQAELGTAYHNGDSFGNDFDGFALNAEVHLDKVNTGKGPLNEAAFLDKSSFVGLSWLTEDFDKGGSNDTVSLDGRFVTQDNVIIEAGFTDFENGEDFSLGLGMYLNETQDVVLTYQTFEHDHNKNEDKSSLGVDLHGVNPLNNTAALAYDFGLSVLDWDGDTGYEVSAGAEYYLDRMLSFSASLAFLDVDNYDESTFQVGVNYFVTPVVRIGADFITVGQDGDGDTLALNANIRF